MASSSTIIKSQQRMKRRRMKKESKKKKKKEGKYVKRISIPKTERQKRTLIFVPVSN